MINFTDILDKHILRAAGPLTLPVQQFSLHSAVPNQNGVFFCRSGRQNSLTFIDEAVASGAICIISDQEDILNEKKKHPDVTFIYVSSLTAVMDKLLAHRYQDAIQALTFLGITGTNGKTTVTYLVSCLLNKLGHRAGSIGTEGVLDQEQRHVHYHKTTPTTPEAPESAKIIQHFHDLHYEAVAFEATSIALDQQRVGFFPVHTGVFTNFSWDHLDYHEDLNHYFESKMKLKELSSNLVYSLDDKAFEAFVDSSKPSLTFSVHDPSADLHAGNIHYDENGTRFHITFQDKIYKMKTPFIGQHNVYNILSACGVLSFMGYDMEDIPALIPSIPALHNRFEFVDISQRRFILDFAHTPAAVEKAVGTARDLADNRLITMVNGIGLRGLEKAARMSAALDASSDHIVLGAEQVGWQDPVDVVDTMHRALHPSIDLHNVSTALSRKQAIQTCMELSNPGDTILLTGINEPQHIQGKIVPHDDKKELHAYFSCPSSQSI